MEFGKNEIERRMYLSLSLYLFYHVFIGFHRYKHKHYRVGIIIDHRRYYTGYYIHRKREYTVSHLNDDLLTRTPFFLSSKIMWLNERMKVTITTARQCSFARLRENR